MVGFFGKTPAQGDFIKHGTASVIAGHFMRWLTDGVEAAARSKVGLPESPVGFLYAHDTESEVLIGAFVPSRDSVGRNFPLAIFTSLDGALAAQHLVAIPRAYDEFLSTAVNILTMPQGHDCESLIQFIGGLVAPDPGTLQPMHVACGSELRSLTMAEFQRQLDPEGSGQHYYAFHALMSACKPLQGKGPVPSGAITLDCPVPSPAMCTAWLEIARELLQWRVPPPLFWTAVEPRHLFLSLGNPPAAVLTYLAGGDPNAAKKWPLQTSSASAITFARDKLTADFQTTIDTPQNTLARVLEALKR